MDGSAKPQKVGVEMVVCRKDRAHKHYTNNPIPTSFLYATSFLDYSPRLLGNNIVCIKRCADGVICVVFECLSRVDCMLGVNSRMFVLLVCVLFCCTIVHHVGEYCSCTLLSGNKKQISETTIISYTSLSS